MRSITVDAEAYHAMRLGKRELAYDLMWDYVRDKLGVAV